MCWVGRKLTLSTLSQKLEHKWQWGNDFSLLLPPASPLCWESQPGWRFGETSVSPVYRVAQGMKMRMGQTNSSTSLGVISQHVASSTRSCLVPRELPSLHVAIVGRAACTTSITPRPPLPTNAWCAAEGQHWMGWKTHQLLASFAVSPQQEPALVQTAVQQGCPGLSRERLSRNHCNLKQKAYCWLDAQKGEHNSGWTDASRHLIQVQVRARCLTSPHSLCLMCQSNGPQSNCLLPVAVNCSDLCWAVNYVVILYVLWSSWVFCLSCLGHRYLHHTACTGDLSCHQCLC